jgi:hypothetical protein
MPSESPSERFSPSIRSVTHWALAAWMVAVCGFYFYFMLRGYWR